MVMAPAKTGSDKMRRKVVTIRLHTKRGIRATLNRGARMLYLVLIKLIDPRTEDAPAK